MELNVIGMKRKHLICEDIQGKECLVDMQNNTNALVQILNKILLGQVVHIRAAQELRFKELI